MPHGFFFVLALFLALILALWVHFTNLKKIGTSKFQLLLLLQYHFYNCVTMSDSFAFYHINQIANITQLCLVCSSTVIPGISDDFTTHPGTSLPYPSWNQETGTTIPLQSTSGYKNHLQTAREPPSTQHTSPSGPTNQWPCPLPVPGWHQRPSIHQGPGAQQQPVTPAREPLPRQQHR